MGWVAELFRRARQPKALELTMRGHEVYVEPMPEPEKLRRAFLRASRIARALEMKPHPKRKAELEAEWPRHMGVIAGAGFKLPAKDVAEWLEERGRSI